MVYVGQLSSSSDLYLLLGDRAGGLDGVGAPVHELGHGVAGLQVKGADAAAPVDRHAVALGMNSIELQQTFQHIFYCQRGYQTVLKSHLKLN